MRSPYSSKHNELGMVLISFTILIALSGVVLGLHYPTDVMMGAVLGSLLAAVSIGL